MNFKNIHIGSLISQRVVEHSIEVPRICNFFKCTEEEIERMYYSKSLDSEILLKWCKLLGYDFFRLYSQHLILFAPAASIVYNAVSGKKKTELPQFKKNIYTKELIDFILELVESGEKSRSQIINEYKIPKTTLYKWIAKYTKDKR
ncbi:transposase [Chryseobacterium sp. BLS98]|jgi:hypothetical protein|uniref:helix-turn-helix domain-containing protein n=1 Tax=Chryseobacterium sp. BLS98 TaxID=885586 RepID=UPI00065AADCC|nr:helix-turn-helix domain-containing protein [Chryseobacterium sp. BLS98]KMQ62717.1 transposase [Chryseobacterium sp. BLS98]